MPTLISADPKASLSSKSDAWLDFSSHEDWSSALTAMASSNGVADICINSRGRVRVVARRDYLAPILSERLTSPTGWDELCELISPGKARLLDTEFGREGARQIDGHRFRISRVREMFGEEFTLRVLPAKIPTPSAILLPDDLVKRFCALSQGLVVFAGATGDGKSTSIAALVGENARRRKVRIATIEDPVEYLHQDEPNGSTFTYREVGPHVASFADALKAAMRMAPNIIVVGEIRDTESAEIALSAAMTGHKVVSTIHSGTVEGAMQRLGALVKDIGASGIDALAQAFRICVAQRLEVSTGPNAQIVPVHEILTWTDSVASKLRNEKFFSLKQDMESGNADGMQLFSQSLAMRRNAGLLTR